MSTFRLIQDGFEVARVDCPDEDDALSEITHYAMMYSQDGPVLIEQRVGRKWKSYGMMGSLT